MKKRRRIPNSKRNRRRFSKTASRVKKKNGRTRPFRGGFRL